MTLTHLLTAAAATALLAGPALAGPYPAQKPDQVPPEMTRPSEAPAAEEAAAPASATVTDPASGPVILRDSPTPPEQAYRLTPDSPAVVTNGPVPDTAENRARYGGPISNGGRRTRPLGN